MILVENDLITVEQDGVRQQFSIGSPEAFRLLSRLWLRSGWDTKHVYSFTWMGRPIIQLPEDMIRLQEVIFRVKPTVIVETGMAHGGSLVFYAALLKAMGGGRVIGIDIEIRPHNRKAIEAHAMFDHITLIEGSSIEPAIVERAKSLIKPADRVMVVLDSNHSKAHVLAELNAYCDLVSVGSYIIAADGIMWDLVGAPRSNPDWAWNNPKQAAEDFVAGRSDFVIESPRFEFNEGQITEPVTYWPSGYIKRVG